MAKTPKRSTPASAVKHPTGDMPMPGMPMPKMPMPMTEEMSGMMDMMMKGAPDSGGKPESM